MVPKKQVHHDQAMGGSAALAPGRLEPRKEPNRPVPVKRAHHHYGVGGFASLSPDRLEP